VVYSIHHIEILSEKHFFGIVRLMKNHCDRCLVILDDATDINTTTQYCSFCCQNGKLLYAADDIHTFRKRYYEKMYAEGANEFVARFHTLLIGSAPYWKVRRG